MLLLLILIFIPCYSLSSVAIDSSVSAMGEVALAAAAMHTIALPAPTTFITIPDSLTTNAHHYQLQILAIMYAQ
jgi:hypothetical protein